MAKKQKKANVAKLARKHRFLARLSAPGEKQTTSRYSPAPAFDTYEQAKEYCTKMNRKMGMATRTPFTFYYVDHYDAARLPYTHYFEKED